MTVFRIVKNAPAPLKRWGGKQKTDYRVALESISVGQAVAITLDGANPQRFRSCAQNLNRAFPDRSFTLRTQGEEIWIYRTK